MTTAAPTKSAAPAPKTWMLWTGRVLSALPVLAMLLSASMKLTHSPQFVEQFVGKFGYPESAATAIGIVEIGCAVLFAIPRTAFLGGILVAAYLGGAVATHVRIGDPSFVAPAILGIIAWAGLYLRDERIRALLPLRRMD